MAPPKTDFPPVRACIFDLDGLLLNTEDINTLCANIVLARYGRPPLPWSIKALASGMNSSYASDIFQKWAELPIRHEQFCRELTEQYQLHFPECRPLPGAKKLLSDLQNARTTTKSNVEIALASGTKTRHFERKVSREEAKKLLSHFNKDRLVLGDDPRLQPGKGKPAPDIYLLALQTINAGREGSGREITPDECLAFEDSVPGVEAARRAGMRVVWVPHPEIAAGYRGREKEVLAGRIGLVEIGDEWQLGEIDDGWAEQLPSLEMFPFEKFGIEISRAIPGIQIPDSALHAQAGQANGYRLSVCLTA